MSSVHFNSGSIRTSIGDASVSNQPEAIVSATQDAALVSLRDSANRNLDLTINFTVTPQPSSVTDRIKEAIDIPDIEKKMRDTIMFRWPLLWLENTKYKGIFCKHILNDSEDISFVDFAFFHRNLDALKLLKELDSPYVNRIPALIFDSIDQIIVDLDRDKLIVLRGFIFSLIDGNVKDAVDLVRHFLMKHSLRFSDQKQKDLATVFYKDLFREIRLRFSLTTKLILLDLDWTKQDEATFKRRADLVLIAQEELARSGSSKSTCLIQ